MSERTDPWELVILLAVGLLFFGNRLPEVMHNPGKSMRGGGPLAGV